MTINVDKNACFTAIPDVKQICDDYFSGIDLNFFGHVSVYPDGKFHILNSRHDCAKFCIVTKRIPPIGFAVADQIQDSICFPTMTSGTFYGWSDEVIFELKERFNILNPMVIFKKFQDHYQFYFFDVHGENAYEHYFNHFEYFENFLHYYNDKAKRLIFNASNDPLEVDQSKVLNMPSALNAPAPKQLEIKKYVLASDGALITVTKREYQCLHYISTGNTMKSAAYKLRISTRTLETYLSRMKIKLNLHTTAELINCYWLNKLQKP